MADSRKSIDIAITSDTTGIVGGLKKVKQQAGDTKKTTDELQTSLEDLGGDVKAKVVVDSNEAQTRVDTVKKQIEGLSGDQAKVVIAANISDIEGQIKKVKGELTTLSDEDVQLAVDVIGNGEQQLKDLRDLADGLSTEKIDIDTTGARGSVDAIGKSADSSRSALANMVGNSAQDLGQLSGVAGSAGVAVGQMAEYMSDAVLAGEALGSTLKSFALVAGPIGILSLAVGVIPSILDAISGKSRQLKKDTDDLTKAFAGLTGSDPASRFQALGDKIDDVLQNSPHLTKSFKDLGISGQDVADTMTGDVTPAVQRVKEEYGDLTGQIADNIRQQQQDAAQSGVTVTAYDAQQQALEDVAAAHGLTKQELQDRLSVEGEAVGKIDELTQATQTATQQDDIRRDVLGNLTDAQGDNTAATEAAKEAADAYKQSLLDEADAMKAQSDALFAASDSTFALQKATRDQDQAFHDLDKTVADINGSTDDAETKQRKLADAYEDAAEKATGVADAAVKLGDDQAAAAGQTQSATAKLDTWNASMLGSASTANGPLHEAIVNHIASVNGIPAEKVTEILAATPNIDEQKRLLDEASANRKLTITADADTSAAASAVDAFVRSIESKTAYIDVKARTGNVTVATAGGAQSLQPRPYADGGMVTALTGERGPEIGLWPTGTNITPNERARNWIQTAAREAVGPVAASTNIYNQTITFLRAIDDREWARLQRRYERRNGSVTIA